MRLAIGGAALSAIVLCLSACDRGDNDARGTGKAEGQILPRSVTDEMLPYDTVRSQPPLAEAADDKTPDGRADRAGGGEDESPRGSDDSGSPAAPPPTDDESQATPDAE
jgi:hypothetical protein